MAHKAYRPNGWISAGAIFFSLIFLFSAPFTLFQSEYQFLRAFVSYAIFMTVFAFAITHIGSGEIYSFRSALILISCFLAGESLVTYFNFVGSIDGEDIKNIVGSQRVGFIYIIGFFVLLNLSSPTRFLKIAKISAILLILAGIMLTYSRSSVIALGGTVGLYILVKALQGQTWHRRSLPNIVAVVLMGFALAVAIYMVFPNVFAFYGDRILTRYGHFFEMLIPFELFTAPDAPLPDDVLIQAGSEGTRLAIWKAIFKHTLENPILGSGYRGSWILDSVTTGSAHSQYMDVLLRVGFLGFVVWALILYKVFLFLRRYHPDLFWGGVGILIYGLFHETFKESQGAFILAFLVGMYVNHLRDRRHTRYVLVAQGDLVTVDPPRDDGPQVL
ncbi:MAG: O-antigen ligase family protein [Rhodocyclaceae bacterium]|nr:O-antigen ligase family protein [Rhodocyclaceae bacterium]